MTTKVIVAGGRDYCDEQEMDTTLNHLFMQDPLDTGELFKDIELVCGKAKGADSCGEEWAEDNGIPVIGCPADWDKHGRSAGHIRNAEMAEVGDILVAFWDGKSKGTKGMIDVALRKGLEIHVYRYVALPRVKPPKVVGMSMTREET